jgi:eIF-2B alpha/beta/delta-like uncharacterized protein
MLPKRILSEITALQKDNRSGAADITLAAIGILRNYLRRSRVRETSVFLDDLRELCGGLLFAQSSMASVRNTCVDVLSTLSKHRNGDSVQRLRDQLERKLTKLSAGIQSARPRIAAHFSKLLPRDSVILTLSYSSTVLGVLTGLWRQGKKFEVIVTESRPALEGRRTAREMAKAGIPTTLIADAALGELSRKVTLAVVGADAIYSDGSTANKVGTFPLALCCKEFRKPFYVLADSSKLNSDSPRSFRIQMANPEELLKTRPPKLSVRNFYFELTPSKYITAIITETGVFSPRTLKLSVR